LKVYRLTITTKENDMIEAKDAVVREIATRLLKGDSFNEDEE